MFTIGDFARLTRVSVRMLRHYDAIGLLTPAHVDPATGYRSYSADQLPRMNRVLALKDLGLTLEQVGRIVDDDVDAEQLRGMLRLRRVELEERIAAEVDRLARVEARLRLIENEDLMTMPDVIVKTIPTTRVAELTATAASWDGVDIGPAIAPLYPELCRLLDEAGIAATGPAFAYYEPGPGDAVVIHAALPVSAEPHPAQEFAIVDVPGIRAATLVHLGSLMDADASIQAVAVWVEEHGLTTVGYPRELYLECPPEERKWVTELQVVLAAPLVF